MSENPYGGQRKSRQTEDFPTNPDEFRIVFVAPQQAIFQCLCSALQDQFRDAKVYFVDRIDDSSEPDQGVRLVLLGAGARLIGVDVIERCQRRFPNAAIAVAVDNGLPVVDAQLIEQRLIQGILPTTLPLDVWFALMRLVMAGGEYLPQSNGAATSHFPPPHRISNPPMPMATAGSAQLPRGRAVADSIDRQLEGTMAEAENGLNTLTAREREILTLVSEGYQNKLIADRMALSEHTVKAHVHNLIAKLRVTNRTQAAAYLHEHRLDRGSIAPGNGDRRRATALG